MNRRLDGSSVISFPGKERAVWPTPPSGLSDRCRGVRSSIPFSSNSLTISCRMPSSLSKEASPEMLPMILPLGSRNMMVGHALTPYCCQTWNSLSLTTGCRISYRLMAWWTLAVFLSDGNFALCTPMTASSSGYFCSSFRNCGSTCMQLIQQYVQKSSSTTLPDRSFRLIAPWLLSHSRPEGKSGASVVPTYDLGCIALTPLWILRRVS